MTLEDLQLRTYEWARGVGVISAVILFGSRAARTASPDSDWDICCLVDSQENEGWYGIWVSEAERWKADFCARVGLQPEEVQFTAPTSEPVLNGMFKCSRVLYLRNTKLT